MPVLTLLRGDLGLVYGSFSYTKETHQAKLGPIQLSVNEEQTVNVPVWAGVGAIVIGGLLLLFWKQEELARRAASVRSLTVQRSITHPRIDRTGASPIKAAGVAYTRRGKSLL
jgi:hypothetical protein